MKSTLASAFAVLMFACLSANAQINEECIAKMGGVFQKNICSDIQNNKAALIKFQLQKKSGKERLGELLDWTKENFYCIRCAEEPGFTGGSMLRRAVFEDAMSVVFFFAYDANVHLNFVEADDRTILDWLRDDTEKFFDAAFETENLKDKEQLLKQITINQKYFNILRQQGAKFRHEIGQF
jgi:hypothetical protein